MIILVMHIGFTGSQKTQRVYGKTAVALLLADGTRRNALEGFAAITFSVWGIAVASPDAMYDLEIGDLYQRLMEKLSIVSRGQSPTLDNLTNNLGVH